MAQADVATVMQAQRLDPKVALGTVKAYTMQRLGNPATLTRPTAEQIAAIRQQLGLDQPWWVQLGIFLKSIVTFDWGKSWATQEPISALFASRLGATLTVSVPILILEVTLAIPFAMAVAYVRGSLTDRAVMVCTILAQSVSLLVYVILGQYIFGFQLGWFPVQGWSDAYLTNLTTYAPLPVLLVVLVALSPYTRLYRTFFLDEIGQDYVRTARAKGLGERKILFKHVLRNAMIPILTNISVAIPGVFVGSFLIETFFSIPGLGREAILAVNRSDYPVIQAFAIYLSVITMSINLLTDLLYKWVDPRVSLK
jgi:peptide/nickel transport system permease protein